MQIPGSAGRSWCWRAALCCQCGARG